MRDKVMIMYEAKTYVVYKDEISEKLWQELKDNRPLTTMESFKPNYVASCYSKSENISNVLLCCVFFGAIIILTAFITFCMYEFFKL